MPKSPIRKGFFWIPAFAPITGSSTGITVLADFLGLAKAQVEGIRLDNNNCWDKNDPKYIPSLSGFAE